MSQMQYPVRRENRLFLLAIGISLLLHALVLGLDLVAPPAAIRHEANRPGAALDVLLSPKAEKPPETLPLPPQKDIRPRRQPLPKRLTALPRKRNAAEPAPSWTQAQRDDMDQFLNELAVEARPRAGRELAQRALAMARTMTLPAPPDDEMKAVMQKLTEAKVDPYSIELYFDALFRKMNRSAAMISQERRTKGTHVAAVRVVVDHDGSVKSFRVLWAADQQAEIAYIQAVVEMAAPFPVFPQDIRQATDSIVLQICILPDSIGGGSGATFSRMSPGQSCGAH